MKLKLVSLDDSSIWMLFMKDGESQFETWFSSPPSSIDHVSKSYLEESNRIGERLTDEEFEFIKSEYKRQYKELESEKSVDEVEQLYANAKLIADVPDLYNAAKELIEDMRVKAIDSFRNCEDLEDEVIKYDVEKLRNLVKAVNKVEEG